MRLLVHRRTEAVRKRSAQRSGSEAFPVWSISSLEFASPISHLVAIVLLALQRARMPGTLASERWREVPVWKSIHRSGLVQPAPDSYQAGSALGKSGTVRS